VNKEVLYFFNNYFFKIKQKVNLSLFRNFKLKKIMDAITWAWIIIIFAIISFIIYYLLKPAEKKEEEEPKETLEEKTQSQK